MNILITIVGVVLTVFSVGVVLVVGLGMIYVLLTAKRGHQ